jgi:hypothetical protein
VRLINDALLSAVSVTGTNAYNSDPIKAESILQFSVQAVTSGSNPNGALKVQFSNDDQTSATSPTNWSDVTSATVSTTNNGVYAIQKIECCAMWLRLVYTNASGSGAITATIKTNGY